jgi:hypothetical protein
VTVGGVLVVNLTFWVRADGDVMWRGEVSGRQAFEVVVLFVTRTSASSSVMWGAEVLKLVGGVASCVVHRDIDGSLVFWIYEIWRGSFGLRHIGSVNSAKRTERRD